MCRKRPNIQSRPVVLKTKEENGEMTLVGASAPVRNALAVSEEERRPSLTVESRDF